MQVPRASTTVASTNHVRARAIPRGLSVHRFSGDAVPGRSAHQGGSAVPLDLSSVGDRVSEPFLTIGGSVNGLTALLNTELCGVPVAA